MKHLKVSLAAALLCIAAGFSPCPAQPTKPKAGDRKWPSRYEITVKVPEALRKHLAKEFLDLATAVYPEADAKLIRQDAEKEFLSEEYAFDVGQASGVRRYCKEGKSKVGFSFWLPLGRKLSVSTTGVPTGMKVKALDKPLTLNQAMPIAESAMKRLFPNPSEFGRMKMFESLTRRDGVSHIFRFRRGGIDAAGEELTVQISVWSNGVIRTVSFMRTRHPIRKIPFEQMAATAKKVIPNFNPKHLNPRFVHYYSAVTVAWGYWPPLGEPESQVRLRTMWDPWSDKVLYSRILNGGTRDKPYRNPDFYFEPTEKAVRSHLEKLVADAASKLGAAKEGPLTVRKRVIAHALAVIRRLRPDAKGTPREQRGACHVLGTYRSEEAVDLLMDRIAVPRRTPEEERWEAAFDSGLPSVDPLEPYPAASTLTEIGMPAIRAMIDALERPRKTPIPKKTLELYAHMARNVLGDAHVQDYFVEEKKHAVKGTEKNYDRLLALLDIPETREAKRPCRRLSEAELEELLKKAGVE